MFRHSRCLGHCSWRRESLCSVLLINHGTDGQRKASIISDREASIGHWRPMRGLPIQPILQTTHQCLYLVRPGRLANDGYMWFSRSVPLQGTWGWLECPFHKDKVQRVACPTSQGPVTGVIDDVFITRCGRWVTGGGTPLLNR